LVKQKFIEMEKIRRYDLDWLRVIVFGLLIFYHVGMFFVPWGWHIKNNVISSELRWPMLFVNQWRLPILFVISGMGTAYALAYRSGWQFIKERYVRLLAPLIFGMLVIVPPQMYLQRLDRGEYLGTYWEFLTGPAFTTGAYPAGNITWNHLWFLPYLLIFSMILTPIFLYFRNNPDAGILVRWRERLTKNAFHLFWFVIPLYVYEALVEPFFDITHNLVWDWFNFISSLTLFFFGFFLISIKDAFWSAIERIWKSSAVIGAVCFSGLLVIWLFFEDSFVIHFTEAFLKVVNLWAWILVLFGLAANYLNRPSNVLAYCNTAVYPFYILHQTITVIIGFMIMDKEWSLWIKFPLLIVGTFGISWLIYEFLIRRIRFLQPLFGVKRQAILPTT
jgi:glucan biosynthesis protein C